MTLAFICGCAGSVLGPDERAFIRQSQPWGLILFKRNVENPAQLHALTASFREIVGRADAPVLIDQEGGRVQRMGPPHWQSYPSAASVGALPDYDRALALAGLAARLIAHDLLECGVHVDCTPVLDVPPPATTSPIIVDSIIRGAIGFDGLLISDDLSMKALGGSFESRAAALFAAGLDMALHCNGDLAEANAVAAATPELAGASLRRAHG